MNNIGKLISPASIAIIGASANPDKVGHQILANIKNDGYGGKIYPVNLKGGKILGLKVLRSVAELKQPTDLAIIVIPKDVVLPAVANCIKVWIKNIIIISAGFSEIGGEGRKLENKIADLCQQSGVTLIGPNCFGLINTSIDLNATFAKGMPAKGSVSFISQSGAIISSMISLSSSLEIGFSKIFSLGNKALVDEKELLEHLYADSETKVIIAYIESLKVTPELTQTLSKNAKTKPTIILFGGKSAVGARAAKSHTGSAVSSYIAIKTYLEQFGVILADDLEDLLLKVRTFTSYQKIGGDSVAIITNAGGPAIATSDAIASAGLSLAKFSDETTKKLAGRLRPETSLKNPIDLLGDATAEDYKTTLEIVAADKNVDSILLLLTPQTSTNVVKTAQVVAAYNGTKPLLSSFVGGAILSQAKKIIEESGKPCFSYPEEAVRGIDTLVDFSKSPERIPQTKLHTSIYKPEERESILKKFDLPFMPYRTINNHNELLESSRSVGYPMVLKTANSESHKSDSAGVVLDIQNIEDLSEAAEKVGYPAAIGKMAYGQLELFLGIKKDENIGTIVLFGTGGIYSEIYADFAYRIAPLSHLMALHLIRSTKIGTILDGARGQKTYDLEKLTEIIINAVTFADSFSNIKEVDFNPIIVTEEDFVMVDVRIIT